ncbi:tetratricopeptide repeat protein [Herbaspirillum sp. GCM10030257]|uniref:tetratricopeptide repeat protein n=1 Tax=Herbaspirillum sp. GCM10030257 TaxID=3273393 RepID=UPI003609D584
MKRLFSRDRWQQACATALTAAGVPALVTARATVTMIAALPILAAVPLDAHAQPQVQPSATGETQKPAMPAPASTSMHGITPDDLAAFPEARSHLDNGNLVAALKTLQDMERAHSDNPNYFNLVGIIALKLADYATAVTAFERVVLMQPENAGAWLDLAISSAEAGNFTSAKGYFDYIENQFSPPPVVNIVIARYRARMAARANVSLWQFSMDAMVGVDTNANSGLQNTAIPLTFRDERQELLRREYLLDSTFEARSDRYVQAGVGARYRQPLGDNLLDVSMGLRTRDYVQESSFSTVSANLSAGLYRPTRLGDASVLMHVEHLWLGGSPLLRNVRAVAQIEHPVESCRIGFSAENEWRRYTELKNFDANILWGQAGVACDWKLADVPIQTIVLGRTGHDNPTGDRAGGVTRHNELIAQVAMPIAWGARAEFSTTFAKAADREGYSSVLEDNAARRLDRRNMRLTVTVPLNTASDVLFLAEDNRFKSNLALFRQSGKSISVGFRYRF